MQRILIWIIILCCRANPVMAQVDSVNAGLSIQVVQNAGTIFKIHPDFVQDLNLAASSEFVLTKHTTGDRYWQHQHGLPEVGLVFSYSTFGNREILGSGLAVFPVVRYSWDWSPRFSLAYRSGTGLAYFTKPFDEFENPENLVIGARWSAIVNMAVGINFKASEKVSLYLGTAFTHYSNGHIKVPNIGANGLFGGFGLTYRPNTKFVPVLGLIHGTKHWDYGTEITSEVLQRPLYKKIRFNFATGIGLHEVEGTVKPYGGSVYPVYFGALGVTKRLSYKSQVYLGVNAVYYTDYHDFILAQQLFEDRVRLNSTKLVLMLGHELFYGKMAVNTQLGLNLYYPVRDKLEEMEIQRPLFSHRWITARVGFNYYFCNPAFDKGPKPFFGVAIRSIGGKADFFEASLGLVF